MRRSSMHLLMAYAKMTEMITRAMLERVPGSTALDASSRTWPGIETMGRGTCHRISREYG
jgi:hypothetical protein